LQKEVNMKKEYSTRELMSLTGTPWYTIYDYTKAGFLPTAKQIPAGKLTRWRFTERDVRFLNMVNFYKAQGYTLQMAVDLATNIKERKEEEAPIYN
jgi:DNA-binding transcriptional MerR regulator